MNEPDYRLAVVIPCYNHGKTLEGVVRSFEHLSLPLIIVNDGSNEETTAEINRVVGTFSNVEALYLPQNRGKGGAVLAGLEKAHELGFSHALQIDADGQHATADAEKMIALSRAAPETLISGRPIYDESVPKKRLIGRYITHFWVWVETWSFSIKDSLCGFRIYPLKRTLRAAHRRPIGLRMDFDPEIMVRFYWEGGEVQFLPTKVIYPEGGISHFNLVCDNVEIAKMHTKLFFRSLIAMPRRLWLKRTETKASTHWADQAERSAIVGILGFQCLYWLYRIGGRALFNLVLLPVLAVFYLTGSKARNAVKDFLHQVEFSRQKAGLSSSRVSPFALYSTFGTSILDRILAWRGELPLGKELSFADEPSRLALTPTTGEGELGKLLLVSHLGVADVCRAIAAIDRQQVVNVLMFEKHARQFKRMMEKTAPESQLHIIAVDEIGPETSVLLSEAIERGEWIAIAADRIPVGADAALAHHNTVPVTFLGKEAQFPIGPYVLANLLKADVVTLFALRDKKVIRIFATPFREAVAYPKRTERQAYYETCAQAYAYRLGYYAARYPQNWFNFYDFWEDKKNA